MCVLFCATSLKDLIFCLLTLQRRKITAFYNILFSFQPVRYLLSELPRSRHAFLVARNVVQFSRRRALHNRWLSGNIKARSMRQVPHASDLHGRAEDTMVAP
eukprot:g2642.t1